MTTHRSNREAHLWRNSSIILHFTGICGAGKTTLANRMAKRCADHGGKAIGTIDWDPHTPDHERPSERAFSRELDRLNNEAPRGDPTIPRQIVEHSLRLIDSWRHADANLILVDRWYESYDHLPAACRTEIDRAIKESPFRLCIVRLFVEEEALRARLLHTKAHRPDAWWHSGPGTVEDWVKEELACQDAYGQFCFESPFPWISLHTERMDWDWCEQQIVDYLLRLGPQCNVDGTLRRPVSLGLGTTCYSEGAP